MQKRGDRRGFSVLSQKVALELDFSGGLWGFTEITIVPNRADLRTIHLHSRQCKIASVKINNHGAEFHHHDPLANLTVSKPDDFNVYTELKRKLYSALSEGEEGELSISVPPTVQVTKVDNQPSTSTAPQKGGSNEYAPLIVRIEYSCRNPADGVQFVLPSRQYPFRVPHMYTLPSSGDASRCWVPCVDNLWERCTWEFEFVVPRSLDADGDSPTGSNYPCIVVCSGEFQQQIIHPTDPDKVIFLYEQPVLTSVQHISFAAGPFYVMPLATKAETAANNAQARAIPQIHAFCLPGHERHLTATISFLPEAIKHYCQELGSYPFGSYKVVFVDDMHLPRYDAATLTLASIDLLYPDDVIDPVFETRLSLSQGAAVQWIGINIYQKTWSDTWLVHGLGSYVASLFLRKLMGNNEYRFRLKKDMMRVADIDLGTMPPICQPGLLEPPDPSVRQFINLKSPIILHILDRRMHKTGTSQGLHRIIPKLVLEALQNESAAALSTHAFLRMCRKAAGIDFRPFAEHWIYGSGAPRFAVKSHFNRKKMAVEMLVTQHCPAWEVNKDDPIALATLRPVQFFDGQMTIRIHEADGTPYEHVLDIRVPHKKYEVPFNTKYKRVRRNTKRFIAKQQAAEAAANPDSAEWINVVDMSFGLGIWEDEIQREDWKVADWTEADEAAMATATYEWIRLDTDVEWISVIAFDQEPFMWVSQLQRDRDTMAQLEAIHALARVPSKIVSSVLTKTVLTHTYFYRVRAEAALALVACSGQAVDYLGLFHLYKLFFRYCYPPKVKEDLFKNQMVPRPNDFNDMSEYFVRKALITALSQVRMDTGETLPLIRTFLIDQLRLNDNSSNNWSDAFYIAHLIGALGCALVSTTAPERGQLFGSDEPKPLDDRARIDKDLLNKAIEQVDRYLDMDRIIPSLRNIVTVAALEFKAMAMMANLIPNDPVFFLMYTREGNSIPVRLAAFDAVFLHRWFNPKLIKYILHVITRDTSRLVSRHVASSMGESLAIHFTTGDIKAQQKEPESILIEEDATKPEKEKKEPKKDVDLMIKTLRKDKEIGRNPVLRESLMGLMLDPKLDQEVRWSLLKLCDLTFRAVEEAIPKLTIHLPAPAPAPIPEAPAKKVKLSLNLSGVGNVSAAPSPKIVLSLGATPQPSALGDGPVRKLPEVATPIPKLTIRPPVLSIVPPVPKPKAVKAGPAWARSGLPAGERKMIEAFLKRLTTAPQAMWFQFPVDPIRHNAPNYFDIVKNPMDFSTIQNKLKNGEYASKHDFKDDFKLMINNVYLYNAAGTPPHVDGQKLEELFDELWKKANVATEKHKPKAPKLAVVLPPPPVKAKSRTPSVATDINVEDELLLAAEAAPPMHQSPVAKQEDDDDLEELLLGAAGKDTEPPPLSPGGEDAEGDDDLDAALWDAADALGTNELPTPAAMPAPLARAPPIMEPTPPQQTPKPKIKVSLNTSKARDLTPKVPKLAASSSTPPIPAGTSRKRGREGELTAVPPIAPSSGQASTPPAAPKGAASLPMDATNIGKCSKLLDKLQNVEYGWIFATAVDSTQPGLENYYNEIKQPMDYGTMRTKMDRKKYKNLEEFASDLRLIFSNARQFNAAAPDILALVDNVEAVWKKSWPALVKASGGGSNGPVAAGQSRSTVSTAWRKPANDALSQVKSADILIIFHYPVDPVLLNLPQYFDVIPKREARDLSTIKTKFDKKVYQTFEDMDRDMKLMFNNSYKFNGKDSDVGAYTQKLEDLWDTLTEKIPSGPDGRVAKRARLA